MSVAIILPARLASTRLPNKLLLEAGGKTILEHTIARAQRAVNQGLIARIIVAADDERLLKVARRSGVEARMTRKDHNSGTDRIAEVAAKISEEFVVNLQADEPEIDPVNIRLVAGLLTEPGETAPMATLATPIHDEATWLKTNVVKVVVAANGNALYFSRAPIPFNRDQILADAPWHTGFQKPSYGLHHLGIYAYRREFLLGYKTLPQSRLEQLEKLEQLRALENGYTIKVGIVQHNPPGIDTQEDFDAFVKRMSGKSKRRH